jgi:hypothetical protein
MSMEFIGYFLNRSGKLRITDPCYNKDTADINVVNAKIGVWQAFIDKNNDKRCIKLVAESVEHSGEWCEKSPDHCYWI